jgi:hypothetical protein
LQLFAFWFQAVWPAQYRSCEILHLEHTF